VPAPAVNVIPQPYASPTLASALLLTNTFGEPANNVVTCGVHPSAGGTAGCEVFVSVTLCAARLSMNTSPDALSAAGTTPH